MYKVFADLDGLLVNLVKGFCKYYKIADPYLNPMMYGCWDFAKNIPNAWKPLGVSFWQNLDPMPDAYQILDILQKKYNDISILTKVTKENHQCYEGKMRWVEKHIPKYIDKVIAVRDCKSHCAGPRKLLIDDFDHNIEAFRKHGGKGILVPRLWNSLHAHSHRSVDYLREAIL